MNSRLPKWMVLPGARPTSVGLLSLAMEMNKSFGGNNRNVKRSTLQIPLPGMPTIGVFCACKI
jgi:hypothetical protein